MKNLKTFENFYDKLDFLKKNLKEDDFKKVAFVQIADLCRKYKIYNFKVNDDLSVDVDQFDTFLYREDLDIIPIKFNRIGMNFNCAHNKLKTLENSPRSIVGYFDCMYNHLTTLVGGPLNVDAGYICNDNNLKDVYGFPEFFHGSLYIYDMGGNFFKNDVNEIINLFPKSKNNENTGLIEASLDQIRFIKFLNEYTVIRNQNTVIESRLKDALAEIDPKSIDRNFEFKNYKII